MLICGIDSGSKGYISILTTKRKWIIDIEIIPTKEWAPEALGKDKNIYDYAFIERQSGRPGDTPTTAFNLGFEFGQDATIANYTSEKLVSVKPQEWQNWLNMVTKGGFNIHKKTGSDKKLQIKKAVNSYLRSKSKGYTIAKEPSDSVAIALWGAVTHDLL